MDPKTGIIMIDGVAFYPGFTFEDFKKTPFYTNQDGIRIIPLKGAKEIDAHKYIASLFFRDGKLYMISLACMDIDIPFDEEEERALLHRQILAEYGLPDANTFPWGTLKVIYDQRSNSSNIAFVYQ